MQINGASNTKFWLNVTHCRGGGGGHPWSCGGNRPIWEKMQDRTICFTSDSPLIQRSSILSHFLTMARTVKHMRKPKAKNKNAGKRLNYNRENLYKAVKEYRDGTSLSLRGLATAYNVPESTMRDRIKGRVALLTSKVGRRTVLTDTEEKQLTGYLASCAELGVGKSKTQVGLP